MAMDEGDLSNRRPEYSVRRSSSAGGRTGTRPVTTLEALLSGGQARRKPVSRQWTAR